MPSKIAITEGSGVKNLATHSISEDAATKELQRVVLSDSAGIDIYHPTNYYSVTGSTSAVIAATLASNTTLVAIRNGGTKIMRISSLLVNFSVATVGTSALVAGSIAWQKFTSATPSGGTARTVAKKRNSYLASTVADVRDSNAALTVAGVSFADVYFQSNIPLMTAGALYPWQINMRDTDEVILEANEGICLRTQVICPGTQTWMYSYCVEWCEV